MKEYINILHLTDLHFGIESNSKITTTAIALRQNTLNELLKCLENVETNWKPDIIAISGDIGWKGCENDYFQAKKWLNQLLNIFSLKNDRLIACPGNHDINLKLTVGMHPPQDAKKADNDLTIENLYRFEELFQNYINMFKDNDYNEYNLKNRGSYLVGVIEILNIKLLILNSSWYSRDGNDKEKLFIGLPLLKFLYAQNLLINPDNYNDEKITICLLHHPPTIWYHFLETKAMINRINTYNYLAERCHIILSGHEHGEPQRPDRKTGRAYLITGGATYKSDDYENNCSIIRIHNEKRIFSRLILDYKPQKSKWHSWEEKESYELTIYNEKFPLDKKFNIPFYEIHSDSDIIEESFKAKYSDIVDYFPEFYKKIIINSLMKKHKICAFLSVTPKEHNKRYDANKRYHLGHYYFVKLIDTFLSFTSTKDENISILMCPSSTIMRGPEFNLMSNTIRSIWNKCFNNRVRLIEIDAFISTQRIEETEYSHLQNWLINLKSTFTAIDQIQKDLLISWRNGEVLTDEQINEFSKLLDITNEDILNKNITANEILALSHILCFPPAWFEVGWFVKAIKSFIVQNVHDNIQHRFLSVNTITILESIKNMTTWEPMSLCCKYFGLGTFPIRAYFKSVSQANKPGPMRTRNYQNAIFLHENSIQIMKKYNEEDIKKVLEFFHEYKSNVDKTLNLILKDGAKRLSQKKYK